MNNLKFYSSLADSNTDGTCSVDENDSRVFTTLPLSDISCRTSTKTRPDYKDNRKSNKQTRKQTETYTSKNNIYRCSNIVMQPPLVQPNEFNANVKSRLHLPLISRFRRGLLLFAFLSGQNDSVNPSQQIAKVRVQNNISQCPPMSCSNQLHASLLDANCLSHFLLRAYLVDNQRLRCGSGQPRAFADTAANANPPSSDEHGQLHDEAAYALLQSRCSCQQP